jgi:riboflavin kinase/FMN adenylyltransferase
MQRTFGSENFRTKKPTAVAIGNFDGVHVGHRRLLDKARSEAKEMGCALVVYTFEPHPARVLSPAECPPLLQTPDQKLSMLEEMGVDACVVERFTFDFAKNSGEGFFKEVLVKRLAARAIVVGYNFTFGIHRQGTVETLAKLCKAQGIAFTPMEAQFVGETLVSSSAIRRLIAEGDVQAARTLLGRPYSIEGRVVAGRGIGRTLGFRTANIRTENEVIPQDGVYAATIAFSPKPGEAPREHIAAATVGESPTFPGGFDVEAHVIGFEGELTGVPVKLFFHERLRAQRKFESPEALSSQIAADVATIKKLGTKAGR